MTRIWIEFDQLDTLKEQLTEIQYRFLINFRLRLFAIIGVNAERGKNDKEILDAIREFAIHGTDEKHFPTAMPMDEGDREECASWANYIINALKEKGDVR
jgi:hypothetical protein